MVLINPICIILPSTEKCICFILALKNQTLASSSKPHTLVITLIQLLINQICLNADLTREMPPVLWAYASQRLLLLYFNYEVCFNSVFSQQLINLVFLSTANNLTYLYTQIK